MTDKEKSLLLENPILHKYGDIFQGYYLDVADSSGNLAPIGYLWVRKYIKPKPIPVTMVIEDVFMDNNVVTQPYGEVIGKILMFDNRILDLSSCNELTLGQVVALYHFNFPKKTIFQKVKEILCGLLKRR